MTTAVVQLDETERIERAWELGRLEWLLDSNQRGVHLALTTNWTRGRFHVLNMSRQIGKSWFAAAFCIAWALQHPNSTIKYAASTAKQVRAIIRPHFRDILKTCPKHLRPIFHTQDGEYRFQNGSIITIGGCETEEKADRLLGQHAHIFIVDEAARIKILNYVLKTIALPMTQNTKGRVIIISTPAPTADHPFKEYCDRAEAKGLLITRTIYENPRLSDAEIQEFMDECGGEDSTEWQREYLVRHVTDIDMAVIKSASERRIREITFAVDPTNPLSYRPALFDPYDGLDLGWSPDFTGIVWGFWHYEQATLFIEDEWMMRQMDTKTLAAVIKAKEQEHWGRQAYMRVGDIDDRVIQDLANDHQLDVIKSSRDDLDAQINNLNLMVAGKKYNLRIHPRCVQLRRQLISAVWDKNRKKFARSRVHGHYDLVAALIYLARNIQYDRVPDGYGDKTFPPGFLVVNPEPNESALVRGLRSFFGQD